MSGSSQSGFALILALSLMAFILLILLAFTTVTQVEVKVASDSLLRVQAQQNAQLALNVAIGELQRYAGPDQRITASAEIQGVSAMPHWTGVFGNAVPAKYSAEPDEIPVDPHQPVLLNWLVSGNEGLPFSFNQTVDGFGHIQSAPGAGAIPFEPNDADSSTMTDSKAKDRDLTIDGKPARLLVAGGSVDADEASTDYVAVPYVSINTGGQTMDGYAFWVGDEGVKAQVSLRDNYMQDPADLEESKGFSLYTSQRNALELITDKDGSGLGNDFAYDNAALEKIYTMDSFPQIGSDSAAVDGLNAAGKYRFHDLTARAQAVLADAYAGGLKKNLSAALASSSVGPSDDALLFPALSSDSFSIPTWGHLRSWANNTVSPNDAASVLLPTDTNAARSPVITYANLIWACGVETDPIIGTNEIFLKLMPMVVLWNPYNVPLEAHTYEFVFQMTGPVAIRIIVNGTVRTKLFMNSALGDMVPAPDDAFAFRLEVPELAPGESRAFNNPAGSDGEQYIAGTNTLVLDPDFDYFSYLKVPTGVVLTDEEVNSGRVQFYGSPSYNAGLSFDASQMHAYLAEPGAYSPGGGNAVVDISKTYHAIKNVSTLVDRGDALISTRYIRNARYEPVHFAFKIQSELERVDINSTQSHMLYNGMPLRTLVDQNPYAQWSLRSKSESFSPYGNTIYGGRVVVSTMLSGAGENSPVFIRESSPAGSNQVNSVYTAHFSHDPLLAPIVDIPRTGTPLLSLGQFQNAPLSLVDTYPTFALGNSAAPARIEPGAQHRENWLHSPNSTAYDTAFYDLSWHLNRHLWDRYYLLGVKDSMAQADLNSLTPLPNAVFDYALDGTPAQLSELTGANSYDAAAEKVMVDGGFNINSTSVEAWKAIIAGSNQVTVDGQKLSAPIARHASEQEPWAKLDAGNRRTYEGNRELVLREPSESDEILASRLPDVIQDLAEAIVSEVKNRGPFLSLSDFINRRLTDDRNDVSKGFDPRYRGTLQHAIDNPSMDEDDVSPVNPMRPWSLIEWWIDYRNPAPNYYEEDPFAGEYYYEDSWRGGTPGIRKSYVSRAAYSNKFLTQADILTSIGSRLSARSDTFRIRAYGEVENAMTGEVVQAWCEAIVQRMPDYVDDEDSAILDPRNANPVNKTFGRKFKIVYVKWLDASDV